MDAQRPRGTAHHYGWRGGEGSVRLTLVSAGSKANEFDIESLKAYSPHRVRHDDAVQEYGTVWGKRIRTLCDGRAVNFHIQSCPEEVMDVVFAEQLACCLHLAAQPRAVGVLHELPDDAHRARRGGYQSIEQLYGPPINWKSDVHRVGPLFL